MVKLDFKSNAAQRIYEDYMNRVDKNISSLSSEDKADLLLEINSHIYEGMVRNAGNSEIDALLDLTGKLGIPEEFLKPLVAKKKLNQAVHSFNPKDVFQAISLNIRNGLIFSVFGLLYLFLFSFIIIAITKVIAPAHTGLFVSSGGFQGLGYINDTAGSAELLGYWIIPLSLIIACFFYFLITLLLRLTRRQ